MGLTLPFSWATLVNLRSGVYRYTIDLDRTIRVFLALRYTALFIRDVRGFDDRLIYRYLATALTDVGGRILREGELLAFEAGFYQGLRYDAASATELGLRLEDSIVRDNFPSFRHALLLV